MAESFVSKAQTPGTGQSRWMIRDFAVPLEALTPETEWQWLNQAAARKLGVPVDNLMALSVVRESIDARHRDRIAVIYTLLATVSGTPKRVQEGVFPYQAATRHTDGSRNKMENGKRRGSKRPVIVGAGPCGLFCALALAQAGLPPLILERGQPVELRQADVMAYWTGNRLNPESNVQFGEGGAGTFSDGKLTTRIHDPRCERVLETFTACGAPQDILWRAKPHLGTDVLFPLLIRLREHLQALGAEFMYGTRMEELLVGNGTVRGVRLADGTQVDTDTVILAIGHSARDTFGMLWEKGLVMEPKPFSVGVRIEHPQELVNRARYGNREHFKLGSAEYQLFERFTDRTAYTFCMCPGGTVVAAASEAGTVVTNGMSDSKRRGGNANSAFVVSVDTADVGRHPLDGMHFQRALEQTAHRLGGGTGAAPVQRLSDFLAGTSGTAIGQVKPTYTGETRLACLHDGLPESVVTRMREAVPSFERRLSGFALPDALLTGFETRTSSPVRIVRGPDFCSPGAAGLYPAGEGAGYAGGIMSAAVDGLRVAEAVLGQTDMEKTP